jgi:hypothetical protein
MKCDSHIVEEMLSIAAKMRADVNKLYLAQIEAGDPALRECQMEIIKQMGCFSEDPIDHLHPEHTEILLVFPFFVALDLVSTIDRERSAKLKRMGTKADVKNDPKSLKYVCDELLDAIGFLTYPPLAPVTKDLIQGLLAGIANFVVLSKVLRQYLEEKEDWYFLEWPDSIDFRKILWRNRFPYAINLIWLSLFVTLADYRVVPEEDTETGQLRFPIIPVFIRDEASADNSNSRPSDGDSVEEPPDCYLIFIQPKNQKDYALAIVGYPYETESPNLELVFIPTDHDDPQMKQNLINALIETERSIMNNLRPLQNAWNDFIEQIGHIPMDNLGEIGKWMNTVVSKKHFMRVSLDCSHLRSKLISLDYVARRDEHLVQSCKQYRKYLDKQHVPAEVVDGFRGAMPFLQNLWNIIAADRNNYDSDGVRSYVEQHRNQCVFPTVKAAVSECRRYHEDFDNNAKRDFFEQLLVRLSAKKGWQISRPVIRNLLKSNKI